MGTEFIPKLKEEIPILKNLLDNFYFCITFSKKKQNTKLRRLEVKVVSVLNRCWCSGIQLVMDW